MELYIFAHQGDGHRAGALFDPAEHLLPFAKIPRPAGKAQLAADDLRQPGSLQHDGRLVEHRQGDVLDHALLRDIAKKSDLVPYALPERLVGARHDDVRHNPKGLQLLDRVLGGLALVLARALDVGHQRDVDEKAILPSGLVRDLADRLQKRLALDVAGGTADLGDHHVGAALLPHRIDEALDLVRDVRDDLHRLPEVLAAALLLQHVPVDLAGGQVGKAVEVLVDEALVMPEVQVGFRAVLGDEHLAVLIGAHGARVHIDIRVELLGGHLDPPRLQKPAERGRRDPLPEPRHHAAGHENKLAHNSTTPS